MKPLLTNAVCIMCLAGLAALQFGWVFWPWLGSVMAIANLGFVLALGVAWLIRRFFRRSLPDRSTPDPTPDQPGAGVESEVDYFALAHLLIDQYGADARAYAGRLTQETIQEDDALATADWRTVEHVIALLSNEAAATRH